MTVLATWLATLGSAILSNLQNFFTVNAPNILSNLFAGKIPAGTGTALLADLEAVGLSKIADLGLTEYMHQWVKDGDNFINDACAANPSEPNLYAVLSVLATHGAVANATQQVLLARAYLQWKVALAINADKAASTPATQAALAAARQARDDAQTYLESLTALQLVELVGNSATVPTAPADLVSALAAVNAFMAAPPSAPTPAPVAPITLSGTPAAASRAAVLVSQSVPVGQPVNVPAGLAVTITAPAGTHSLIAK